MSHSQKLDFERSRKNMTEIMSSFDDAYAAEVQAEHEVSSTRYWIRVIAIVLLLLGAGLVGLIAGVATAADPIVGVPIPNYPPAWYVGLEDLPPCVSADRKADYQRGAVYGFVRITAADGGHAPISGTPAALVTALARSVAQISLPGVSYAPGGMLWGAQVRDDMRGRIIICESSSDGQWTFASKASAEVRAGVMAAWRDPVTPILNVMAVGPSELAPDKIPEVIPGAITVNGFSNAPPAHQGHLVNLLGAMRPSVREALRVNGTLCDVVAETLRQGIEQSTGRKAIRGVHPRIDNLTTAQHLALAATVAELSNRLEAVPTISDFDRWFNANGAGLDRASARAGWDARGNQQ